MLVTCPFNDNVGSTLTRTFVEILKRAFDDVFVLTGNLQVVSDDKIHVWKMTRHVSNSHSTATLHLLEQFRVALHLPKLLEESHTVVFYIGARTYILPVLFSKLLHKNIIVIAAGSSSKTNKMIFRGIKGKTISLFAALLEKSVYSLADTIAILHESKNIIDFFELRNHIKKISRLPDSYIDTDSFKITRGLDERDNVVGYLGRLSREKGIMEFVEAMPMILARKPDVRFLIVGDGPLKELVKKKMEPLVGQHKADMVGYVPHEKVPDLLNRMKILVIPSYTEAFAEVSREAMACGAICVANSVGGLPDIIVPGETGFLLEDNSPETIALKTIKTLDYRSLSVVQKNARKFVETEMSLEKAVQLWKCYTC